MKEARRSGKTARRSRRTSALDHQSPYESSFAAHNPQRVSRGAKEPEYYDFVFWWTHRENYARTGEEKHLNFMLWYVTLDNPPDAPRRRARKIGLTGWVTGAAYAALLVVATMLVLLNLVVL